jgi:ribonuclease-3
MRCSTSSLPSICTAPFPPHPKGDLSRLRSRLVSGESLAQVAAALGLGEALHLGSGELKTGGFRRKSILADALEALCGAIFLDGGLDDARHAVEALFAARIAEPCRSPPH